MILPNSGNQDSLTTTFTDILPTNTTYVLGSASTSSGNVTYSTLTKGLTWNVAVDAGSQVTLQFKATVNNDVKIRDVISNQGEISYGSSNSLTDSDLSLPGKQSTQILVGGVATLSAIKEIELVGGGNFFEAGSQVLYTISIQNIGIYNVSGASFTDTIPNNTIYLTSDTDTGIITFDSNVVTVTGINLASGSTATIHIYVQISNSLPSGITQVSNQGTVSWDSNQSGLNNTSLLTDSDLALDGQQPSIITVEGSPQGVASKSVTDENGGNLVPGDILLYTIVMKNQSGYIVNGIEFVDSIPSNTSYVTASISAPPGSTVVSETPTMNITGINIPAHGQISLVSESELIPPYQLE